MRHDEALDLALVALGEIEWSNNSQWQSDRANVAITAIKQALAASAQEPLFWYRPCLDGMYEGPVHNNSIGGKMLRDEKPDEWKPLYTTPPAAQPAVPLTDEQIDAAVKAWFENDISPGRQPFEKRMRAAIKAAHGITEKGGAA